MIIHVDPMDELNTIIHRLRDASDPDITLSVPEHCDVLKNQVNLRLLAKYAKDWDKKLTVDSEDNVLNRLAAECGLLVKTEQLEAATDEHEHKAKKKPFLGERFLVLLIIIVALGILVFVNLPQTVVVVTPVREQFTESIYFDLEDLEAASLLSGSASLTRRTPATGRQSVGISRATGDVVLVNQSQSEVVIPKGTEVTTASNISFVTLNDVTVPPISTQYFMDVPTGLQAGRAEVSVEAVDPGTRGNVSAGRLQGIVGFEIDVRNPEPTTGGADATRLVSTREDIERARQMVSREASQLAKEALQAKAINSILLENTMQVQIDWREMSSIAEETEEVFASAIIRGQAFMINPEQLTSDVSQVLPAIVPEGFELVSESIEVNSIRLTEDHQGLEVDITGECIGIIEVAVLQERLLGIPLTEVSEVSASFPEISSITVPEGTGGRLPRLKNWLQISIERE